jgi:hypothetical protein
MIMRSNFFRMVERNLDQSIVMKSTSFDLLRTFGPILKHLAHKSISVLPHLHVLVRSNSFSFNPAYSIVTSFNLRQKKRPPKEREGGRTWTAWCTGGFTKRSGFCIYLTNLYMYNSRYIQAILVKSHEIVLVYILVNKSLIDWILIDWSHLFDNPTTNIRCDCCS